MPDVQYDIEGNVLPHQCWYGDECRHTVTLEQWAAKHPDEAWELLGELPSPHSRMAGKLREALGLDDNAATMEEQR